MHFYTAPPKLSWVNHFHSEANMAAHSTPPKDKPSNISELLHSIFSAFRLLSARRCFSVCWDLVSWKHGQWKQKIIATLCSSFCYVTISVKHKKTQDTSIQMLFVFNLSLFLVIKHFCAFHFSLTILFDGSLGMMNCTTVLQHYLIYLLTNQLLHTHTHQRPNVFPLIHKHTWHVDPSQDVVVFLLGLFILFNFTVRTCFCQLKSQVKMTKMNMKYICIGCTYLKMYAWHKPSFSSTWLFYTSVCIVYSHCY